MGGINKRISEIADRDHVLRFRLAGAAEAKQGIDQIAKATDAAQAAGEKANSFWTEAEAASGAFFSHVAEGWVYIADAFGGDQIAEAFGTKNLHDSLYGTQQFNNMKEALSDMRASFQEALDNDKLKGTHEALQLAAKDAEIATDYLHDMKTAGDAAGQSLAKSAEKYYESALKVEQGTSQIEALQVAAERQEKAASASADLYRTMDESMKKLQPETDPLKKLGAEIDGLMDKAEHDFSELGKTSNSALQLREAMAALDRYEVRLLGILANTKAVAAVAEAAKALPSTITTPPVSAAPQFAVPSISPVLGQGGVTAQQLDTFKTDATAQVKLLAQAYGDLVTPADKFRLVESELDVLLKNSDGSWKDAKNGAAAYASAMQAAREEMAKATDELDKLLAKTDSVSAGFQAFILQMTQGGKTGAGAFTLDFLNKGLQGFEDETVKALTGAKTNWSSFFESLDQMALKFMLNGLIKQLLQPLSGSGGGGGIFGSIGALLGLGGGGGASAGGADLADFASGSGANIAGFASGTDSAPGGLSWVGEDGPELMNVPEGASITPSSALRGGITIHMPIDAKGAEIGVEQKIARALSAALPHFVMRALTEASEVQKRTPR